MCGFVGIVNHDNSKINKQILKKALLSIGHRGPDGRGCLVERNVGLGHNRLAVFDVTEAGNQPMQVGHCAIVFNGAIYNFPEIRKELEALGGKFSSETDTEVIIRAYLQWGTDCVQKFNGQWAFAIYDARRQQLFCSRDRFGIKPLYYGKVNRSFIFASEIKAFRAMAGWQPRINVVRAYEYLVWGRQDHTEETLFKGIRQLKKGHNLTIDIRSERMLEKRYYTLIPAQDACGLGFEEAKTLLTSLIKSAVQLRLRADVRVGGSLSGGIDSSTILGFARRLLPAEPSAFKSLSVCFSEKKIDEESYIDAVLAKNELEGIKLRPDRDEMEAALEATTWHQDEPIGSLSVVAQHLLFKTARGNGFKVMLGGQGADEIFAGYEKFYIPYLKSLLRSGSLSIIPALFNLVFTHRWNWRENFTKYWTYRKVLCPSTTVEWIHPHCTPKREVLFQRRKEDTILSTSMNLLEGMGLGALLHYEDRNAMAFGIESRLPFLDHHLVEFVLGLPDQYKIKHGLRKYILREAATSILPAKVKNRRNKIGFAAPHKSFLENLLARLQSIIPDDDSIILKEKLSKSTPPSVLMRIYFFQLWRAAFDVKSEGE